MIPCQFSESHVIRAFQDGMVFDMGIVSKNKHIAARFDSVGVKPGAGFRRRDETTSFPLRASAGCPLSASAEAMAQTYKSSVWVLTTITRTEATGVWLGQT
jgi:hypothetical protein